MSIIGQSDRMIQPGQTEEVVINVPTGNRRGQVTKSVFVETNDRANAKVTLECVAKVLTALKCEPENVLFGQVKRSYPAQKNTVKISRGDAGPIKPEVLSTGNPQIKAEIREIEPGEKYELDVTIEPPWPNGMLRGNMQLKTGIPEGANESLLVTANIAPRLQVSPQRFVLRGAAASDLRLVARLNWDDDNPGHVVESSVNAEELKVSIEEQNGQEIVVLNVPTGYTPPRGRAVQVTLKTDDPAVPVVTIPVFAMGGQATPGAPTATPTAAPVTPGSLRPTARDASLVPARPPTTAPAGSGTTAIPQ
ncbi:MAG: hypothetical protein KA383_13415 [Phycisphaerae bacterium]|nr:hypothetical protein [Phycisphaerae bacterium]